MKKRFLRIVSLLVATLISLGTLGACNLITTDNDKDMNRVVATVNVTHEENITKRDMVMQYMNYGYIYVNYYGYTVEKTYDLILDNMLQTKIMVQYVVDEFEKGASKYGVSIDTTKTGIEKFLKVDEANEINDVVEAEYNAYKAVNDLLDSYVHNHEEETKQDTIIGEVRTTPTGAANEVVELTLEQKKAYVEKYKNGFDINSDADRRSAYNKAVKLLEDYSLLGDFGGDLRKSIYFKNTLKSNQESLIIKYYENYIRDSIISALTYDKDIKGLYAEKYDAQKQMSNKEFVEALGSATATEPVLVSNNGTYGYVYNILLGASTTQTDDIAKIKTDNKNITNEKFAEERAKILNGTKIKDLRSSWIQSGYDFDGEKFTGDYTLVKDPANSLAFKGTTVKVKDEVVKDGVVTEKAKYSVTDIEEFELAEFINMVETYVGGTFADAKASYNNRVDYANDNVYVAKTLSGEVSEYDGKIEELLFAFSTDPGSLNKFGGYLIKPPVDGADTEEFVKTFGDAGRVLLENGKGYVVVASDYGYHLMFYSEIFDTNYDYESLDKYLDSLNIDKPNGQTWAEYFNNQIKDWDEFAETDNYLYFLANSLVSQKITDKTESDRNDIINRYRYEEDGAVVIDEDVYNSLIG